MLIDRIFLALKRVETDRTGLPFYLPTLVTECLQLACLRDVPNGLAPQLPDVEPLRDGEPLPL